MRFGLVLHEEGRGRRIRKRRIRGRRIRGVSYEKAVVRTPASEQAKYHFNTAAEVQDSISLESIIGVSLEFIVGVRQIDPVSTPDRSQIGPRSTAVRAQIEAHVNLINLVY